MRSAAPARPSSSIRRASSGVRTSAMYRKSICRTSQAGSASASSRHTGFPARLAARSQAALTTAPIAMCITPFSGPSQRS